MVPTVLLLLVSFALGETTGHERGVTTEDYNGDDQRDIGCYIGVRTSFQCVSGKCVPKTQVCDGIDNCDDGSDEHHCPELGSGLPDWDRNVIIISTSVFLVLAILVTVLVRVALRRQRTQAKAGSVAAVATDDVSVQTAGKFGGDKRYLLPTDFINPV